MSHRRQNFTYPTLGLRDRYFDLFFFCPNGGQNHVYGAREGQKN